MSPELLAWQDLNRKLGQQPQRLFVPDDGPADDLLVCAIGTPAPTVNLRKPAIALSAK